MYRFLVDLLQPFTVLYVFLLVTIALLWRKRVESRRRLLLVTVPAVVLAILCTPAVGFFALGSLEWQYPPRLERPPGDYAIVVLSGWAFRPNELRPEPLLGLDSQWRSLHAAWLYRQGPPCPIVVSGGKVETDDAGQTLAAMMRDFLVQHDVNADDIILEDRSRSTYENALYTAELLKQRGIHQIVLVTTAWHMPRAVRCFEAQGLDVIPSGCDYQTAKFNWSLLSFVPRAETTFTISAAFHEWLGLILYGASGRL